MAKDSRTTPISTDGGGGFGGFGALCSPLLAPSVLVLRTLLPRGQGKFEPPCAWLYRTHSSTRRRRVGSRRQCRSSSSVPFASPSAVPVPPPPLSLSPGMHQGAACSFPSSTRKRHRRSEWKQGKHISHSVCVCVVSDYCSSSVFYLGPVLPLFT